MSYPSAQDIRQELPNEGKGVTEAQLYQAINDGEEIVTLGLIGAEENAYSRRAVRHYARAEALRIMRNKGDRISQEQIDAASALFNSEADTYRALTSSTSDDPGIHSKAIVGNTPW